MNEKTVERITKNWTEIDQMEKNKVASVPRLLMLEVTNACNLKCKMCGNPKMNRKKGIMPLELGKNVIRDAAEMGIKEVALYTTGEPLLCPHLAQFIVEAKKNNLYCFVTSNGLLLDKKSIEMLCDSELDSFKFSIDGTNKKEYETIRRQGNFDTLLNNVRLLKEIRDNKNSRLKIICAMVVTNDNQNHLSDFKKLFEPMADDILISKATNLGGKYDKQGLNEKILKNSFKPCRLLWDRIIVNYDGKITACCVDFDAELVYADYYSDKLIDAWNNETIQNWRNNHLTGNINNMPLCNKCDAPYVFDAEDLKDIMKNS